MTALSGCPAGSMDASAGDDASDDGDDGGGSPCAPPDSDGVVGGCYAFDVTVDEAGFSPRILKAQNSATIILRVTNAGTRSHDFVMGCLPIDFPGCPAQSCFPSKASLTALAPGASATATFVTPYVEGIYDFRSDVPGDSQTASDGGLIGLWGQFVVQ
jgi:hypothetical protein